MNVKHCIVVTVLVSLIFTGSANSYLAQCAQLCKPAFVIASSSTATYAIRYEDATCYAGCTGSLVSAWCEDGVPNQQCEDTEANTRWRLVLFTVKCTNAPAGDYQEVTPGTPLTNYSEQAPIKTCKPTTGLGGPGGP